MHLLAAEELGYLNGVVRLAPRLLLAVVDEDRVALAPGPVLAVAGRVRRADDGVAPDAAEPLVALPPGRVVLGGQAEAVAAPDGDDAAALLRGRQELGAHGVDVVRARRGPDHDVEGVNAVGQEL